MSLQEIIEAVRRLPRRQQQQLIEELRRSAEAKTNAGGDAAAEVPTDPQELAAYRRRLAEQIDWQGGDGLAYQLRLRAEWDDRPGWDD